MGNDLFLRGDSIRNGRVDLCDAVYTLGYLFLGGLVSPCPDAADADDSGLIDIADPIRTLGTLFLGEDALPVPAVSLGRIPLRTGLPCVQSSGHAQGLIPVTV